MNKITSALLLKEEASRGHVAIVYGLVGLVIGTLVLGGENG